MDLIYLAVPSPSLCLLLSLFPSSSREREPDGDMLRDALCIRPYCQIREIDDFSHYSLGIILTKIWKLLFEMMLLNPFVINLFSDVNFWQAEKENEWKEIIKLKEENLKKISLV